MNFTNTFDFSLPSDSLLSSKGLNSFDFFVSDTRSSFSSVNEDLPFNSEMLILDDFVFHGTSPTSSVVDEEEFYPSPIGVKDRVFDFKLSSFSKTQDSVVTAAVSQPLASDTEDIDSQIKIQETVKVNPSSGRRKYNTYKYQVECDFGERKDLFSKFRRRLQEEETGIAGLKVFVKSARKLKNCLKKNIRSTYARLSVKNAPFSLKKLGPKYLKQNFVKKLNLKQFNSQKTKNRFSFDLGQFNTNEDLLLNKPKVKKSQFTSYTELAQIVSEGKSFDFSSFITKETKFRTKLVELRRFNSLQQQHKKLKSSARESR